jgi:hypothetical protein
MNSPAISTIHRAQGAGVKNTSERYESTAAIRDDILRHLNGWTVLVARLRAECKKRDDDVKSMCHPALETSQSRTNVRYRPMAVRGIGLADAMNYALQRRCARLAVRPTSAIVPNGEPDADPLRRPRCLSVDFVLDGRIQDARQFACVFHFSCWTFGRAQTSWADQFEAINTPIALDLEDSNSAKVAEVAATTADPTPAAADFVNAALTTRAPSERVLTRTLQSGTSSRPGRCRVALEGFEEAIQLDPNYRSGPRGTSGFFFF